MTNRYLKVSTDESYRETQPHGNPDFPFRYYLENVYEFDFHSIAWHWHPEFEIIYVRDGSIDCLSGTDRIELAQGYGLFVNSGVLHCYQARADNVMPNIVFAPELLGEKQGRIYTKYVRPIVESGMPYQILDPSVAWQSEILQVLQAVFELQNRGDSCELETSAQIFRLWQILSQNMPSQSTTLPPDRAALHRSQLQIMMQYMHANYRNPIRLKDIAATVYIGENTALQIFRQGIHISPVAYLIRYRLARAAELLLTTDRTVTSIAQNTGFDNAGYFCRKFKEHYRISASDYRKRAMQTVEAEK